MSVNTLLLLSPNPGALGDSEALVEKQVQCKAGYASHSTSGTAAKNEVAWNTMVKIREGAQTPKQDILPLPAASTAR